MTLKMIEAFRNLRNRNGDDVRTIAVSKRSTNEEIMKYLAVRHKLSLNTPDKKGITPTHILDFITAVKTFLHKH